MFIPCCFFCYGFPCSSKGNTILSGHAHMFTAYQVKLLSLVSVIQGWPDKNVILKIMKTHGILFKIFFFTRWFLVIFRKSLDYKLYLLSTTLFFPNFPNSHFADKSNFHWISICNYEWETQSKVTHIFFSFQDRSRFRSSENCEKLWKTFYV